MEHDHCMAFLERVATDDRVALRARVMTSPAEIELLAANLGYRISEEALQRAATRLRPELQASISESLGSVRCAATTDGRTAALPDYFELRHQACQQLLKSAAKLKVRLSVDLPLLPNADVLEQVARCFQPPASDARGGSRYSRFVDINQNPTFPGYSHYLDAKVELARILTETLHTKVRMSGSFYYPPGGFLGWHTNRNSPGWRLYVSLVESVQPSATEDRTPSFCYLDRRSGALVVVPEGPRNIRLFRIPPPGEPPLWHCAVNPTLAMGRWSFGFLVADEAGVVRAWRQSNGTSY